MPSPNRNSRTVGWSVEYRLDRDAWKRACRHQGIENNAQAAAALHLTDTTISRVLSGKTRPSNEFMAHIRRYWPGEQFEDLFRLQEAAA